MNDTSNENGEQSPLDEITEQANEFETNDQAESDVQATLPAYTMQELSESLRQGLIKQGWADLMPVQARAIPYMLAHRDLMIQSRTGSGKTGAYLIPILERIKPDQNVTQALVLVPTRELAVQVTHEAEALSSAMDVRVTAVYGGVGYREQLEAFRQGAHLVIGTPGRILDHLLRRSMTLDRLHILVFDEADRMLSMGFYPDMKRVQRYLPEHPINTYMFSATYPPRVIALANEFMRKPDFLNLSSDHVHVTETEHIYYTVPGMDKERSLVRIIEIENPATALIFANTRERVHFVNVILQRYGYQSDEISSDLSQAAREEVMVRIRQGQLRFLVATDVAARGIDLPELSHVILYEPPEEVEAYIHRAGRTGRAGASGTAISLVNSLEKVELMRIGKRYAIQLQERPLPTDEDVQQVVSQRTEALLESRMRSRDRLQTERMQRFLPFLRSLGDDDEALSGLAMLLDDFYHQEFHTAQLPPIEGTPPQAARPQPKGEGRRGRQEGGRQERARRGGQRSASQPGEPRRTSGAPAETPPAVVKPAAGAEQPSRRRRRRRGHSRQEGGQHGGESTPPPQDDSSSG